MSARLLSVLLAAGALALACGGEEPAPLPPAASRVPLSAASAEGLLAARTTTLVEEGPPGKEAGTAPVAGPSVLVQARLIDEHFRAVAGGELIWLESVRPGARARVAADRSGAAFLAIPVDDLPAEGALAFVVQAPGFARELVPEAAGARGKTNLDLGEILLRRGGSASGRIVDEGHQPLAGRTVVLTLGSEAAWHDPFALSQRDGRFVFPGLPAGSYSLVVVPAAGEDALEPPERLALSIVIGEETKLGEIVLRASQAPR
jgi:hypothetical protein